MSSKLIVRDGKWRRIRAAVDRVRRSHAKVGILQSAGAGADVGGISLVGVAAVHEFGSTAAGIPERSFLRSTLREKRAEIAQVTANLAKQVLEGKMTTARALSVLGMFASAEMKKTITAGEPLSPALLPATIERKGSSRPLVDTGRIVNSITYQVVGSGGSPTAGASDGPAPKLDSKGRLRGEGGRFL